VDLTFMSPGTSEMWKRILAEIAQFLEHCAINHQVVGLHLGLGMFH